MNITLKPETQQRIRHLVSSGAFSSPDEVVQIAMDRLMDYDETVADIRRGMADEAAGRVIPLAEAIEEVRKNHDLPQ